MVNIVAVSGGVEIEGIVGGKDKRFGEKTRYKRVVVAGIGDTRWKWMCDDDPQQQSNWGEGFSYG